MYPFWIICGRRNERKVEEVCVFDILYKRHLGGVKKMVLLCLYVYQFFFY